MEQRLCIQRLQKASLIGWLMPPMLYPATASARGFALYPLWKLVPQPDNRFWWRDWGEGPVSPADRLKGKNEELGAPWAGSSSHPSEISINVWIHKWMDKWSNRPMDSWTHENELKNERPKKRMNSSANEGMKVWALWPQLQSGSWDQHMGEGGSLRAGRITESRVTPFEMPKGGAWLALHGHSHSESC